MHKPFNVLQRLADCSAHINTVRAAGPLEAATQWADDYGLGDGEHATLKIWQADVNEPYTTWNVSAEYSRTYTAQLVVEPVQDIVERLRDRTLSCVLIPEAIAEIQRLRALVKGRA